MDLSRRKFTALGIAAVAGSVAGGEARSDEATKNATGAAPPAATSDPAGEAFDAGPLSDYGNDGVYDAFRDDGFFLVRRDREIIALSSVCTHRGCKVRPQQDRSYLCKCHGSRFDPAGKVVKRPAKRDLPRLKVALDQNKHVLVKLPPAPRGQLKGTRPGTRPFI